MKRLPILTLCLILASESWGLFGLEKIKPLQADFSLLKANVGSNADALAKVTARLDKIEANLWVQVDAKIAAYDKSTRTTNTAGRDQNQTTTTTNDSALMQFIFDKWGWFVGGLFGSLFTFFGTLVAQYERLLMAKDKAIESLIKRIEVREQAEDEWQTNFIQSQTDRIKELTDKLQSKGVI